MAKKSLKIPVDIHQADDKGNCITTLKPFKIQWNGKSFTVPAGFESDGASIPRFFWRAAGAPIDPKTIRAALAHDYIYRTQPEDWTRKEADKMFYDLCREDGLGWLSANEMYLALRLWGQAAWDENKEALEADK